MKYLFYDVETPNRHNDSICAVGWALYDENVKIAQDYQLINPRAPFDPFNTCLHGVCAADVCGCPTFGEYWAATLEVLMTTSTVIAHSAGFDMTVTEKALAADGIKLPDIQYYDSLPAFRAIYPKMRCKLSELAARFGYSYRAHHAGEDAAMLADVMSAACLENDYIDFSEFFEAANASVHTGTQTEVPSQSPSPYERQQALIRQIIDDARARSVDLSEVHFAFHGDLWDPPVPRKNGLDMIVEALGGTFHNNVSGKVDYYVCFDDIETNTVLKARGIAGDPRYHLKIIDAHAFLSILGFGTCTPDHYGPSEVRARRQRERDEKEAAAREIEAARALKAAKRAEAREKKQAEQAERPPKSPRGRPVRQLDRDGNLIEQFPTVAAAAAAVGVSSKCIRDVLAGEQKTAAGYWWEAVEEPAFVEKTESATKE